MADIEIIQGDCKDVMADMKPKSVQCCITSPPYWGLRDYGVDGQIGLEPTPDEYVAKMVEVFRSVWRVLKDDGTLWLNLGDTYAGGGRNSGNSLENTSEKQKTQIHSMKCGKGSVPPGLKPKDLCGIPWRVAFALQADGWYLRSDIIWHKPNPMPESVTDRPTKSHEYIFLLSKQSKYYYDNKAISTPMADTSFARLSQDIENQEGSDRVPGKINGPMKAVGMRPVYGAPAGNIPGGKDQTGRKNNGKNVLCSGYCNKRTVWTVTTQSYKEAHFATFPEKLIEPCVKAGCPKGGVILDPFAGAGTVGIVCERWGRNHIGVELNPDYCDIARKRIEAEKEKFGLFERVENDQKNNASGNKGSEG